jgi:hypothetical protein
MNTRTLGWTRSKRLTARDESVKAVRRPRSRARQQSRVPQRQRHVNANVTYASIIDVHVQACGHGGTDVERKRQRVISLIERTRLSVDNRPQRSGMWRGSTTSSAQG